MGSPTDKTFKFKRLAFAREYCKDGNAAQAALRVGYSPKCNRRTANRMLKDPLVKAEIEKRMRKISEKADCTAERVLTELARIAFCDSSSFVRVENGRVKVVNTDDLTDDQRAAVAEVKETTEGISAKAHDKIRALELIGKHLKLFTDKLEHSGEIKVTNTMSDEELEQIARGEK
jgi:phage terminase small subunit